MTTFILDSMAFQSLENFHVVLELGHSLSGNKLSNLHKQVVDLLVFLLLWQCGFLFGHMVGHSTWRSRCPCPVFRSLWVSVNSLLCLEIGQSPSQRAQSFIKYHQVKVASHWKNMPAWEQHGGKEDAGALINRHHNISQWPCSNTCWMFINSFQDCSCVGMLQLFFQVTECIWSEECLVLLFSNRSWEFIYCFFSSDIRSTVVPLVFQNLGTQHQVLEEQSHSRIPVDNLFYLLICWL